MKCSCCGEPARYSGERDAPGQPKAVRAFCGEKKCMPKESGWTLYPLAEARHG